MVLVGVCVNEVDGIVSVGLGIIVPCVVEVIDCVILGLGFGGLLGIEFVFGVMMINKTSNFKKKLG